MKLILHADDLGLHRAINRAIFDAAEKGVLTSASLLVNGPAAEESMEKVKSFPWLGLGLHLNIVRGRPLSDPSEIPTLVDGKGMFFNSPLKLIIRSCLGKLSIKDIYLEYRCQLIRMMDRGLIPTHFDGEKHTHLLIPEAVKALKRIMGEFNIRKVRTIRESPVNRMLSDSGVSMKKSMRQKSKLVMLELMTKRAKREWGNIKTPDYFFGVAASGTIRYPDSLEAAAALFRSKMKGTIEWMFHPGYPVDLNSQKSDNNLGKFFLSKKMPEELKLLLSEEFGEKIRKYRNNLMSYREL